MARKKKEKPEEVRIYDGENIQQLAKEMTGSSSKVWKLLAYSGLNLSTLKKGDIIKWDLKGRVK